MTHENMYACMFVYWLHECIPIDSNAKLQASTGFVVVNSALVICKVAMLNISRDLKSFEL